MQKSPSFAFDKFMDVLVVEEKKKRRSEQEETPQKALVRRYAETPANRTRFVVRGTK